MHPGSRTRLLALLALASIAGCALDSGSDAPQTASEAAPQPEASPEKVAGAPTEVSTEDQEAILQTGPLGEWHSVGLQGMDDTDRQIQDPSSHTLTFSS